VGRFLGKFLPVLFDFCFNNYIGGMCNGISVVHMQMSALRQ